MDQKRKNTLLDKRNYERAIAYILEIDSSYSIGILRREANLYNKKKESLYRKSYGIYRKYKKCKKLVIDYERNESEAEMILRRSERLRQLESVELIDNGQTSRGIEEVETRDDEQSEELLEEENSSRYEEEQQVEDLMELKCINCYRRSLNSESDTENLYNIVFSETNVSDINFHRKFNSLGDSSNYSGVVTLCKECNIHLTSNGLGEYNTIVACWPSFIWFLLKDRNIHQEYGIAIWRFIPFKWRKWWLASLIEEYNDIYNDVTMTFPSALFEDITPDLRNWNKMIESYLLSDLSKACNNYLRPTVMFPWG